jgi:ribonucleoside-diphosphate reductase alpha chain
MSTLRVKKRNGKLEEICPDKITQCVQRCSSGLNKVSVDSVVSNAKVQFYDKIPTREIDKALVFSARDLIQNHPEYSYLAARILLSGIYKDVFRESADSDVFVLQYRKAFVSNLKYGIKNEKFDPRLADFDLKALASRIDPSKDLKFKYLGAQTLVDRYLSKVNDQIIETPQAFWMRVAMGLSLNAPNPTEMAIEIYEAMADHRYSHSTPTLFN